MAGYDRYSMSNNARTAYSMGEKPWTKWTKKEINETASEELTDAELLNFRANTLTIKTDELKKLILVNSSWHHTSKFFNETNFYSLNFEEIKKLTCSAPHELKEKILKQDAIKAKKALEKEARLEAYRLDQEKRAKEEADAIAKKLHVEFPEFKAIATSWKESNSWRGFSKVANAKARDSFEELTGYTFNAVSAEAFLNFRKFGSEGFIENLFLKLNK